MSSLLPKKGSVGDWALEKAKKIDSAINNALIGDLDWQRQKELFNKELAFNSLEAQKNRDYQMELSNSAYQRAVADLQKAGLNPYSAVGNPASTPTGSYGHSGAHTSPRLSNSNARILSAGFGMFGNIINSAISSKAKYIYNRLNSKINAIEVQNSYLRGQNSVYQRFY